MIVAVCLAVNGVADVVRSKEIQVGRQSRYAEFLVGVEGGK